MNRNEVHVSSWGYTWYVLHNCPILKIIIRSVVFRIFVNRGVRFRIEYFHKIQCRDLLHSSYYLHSPDHAEWIGFVGHKHLPYGYPPKWLLYFLRPICIFKAYWIKILGPTFFRISLISNLKLRISVHPPASTLLTSRKRSIPF